MANIVFTSSLVCPAHFTVEVPVSDLSEKELGFQWERKDRFAHCILKPW